MSEIVSTVEEDQDAVEAARQLVADIEAEGARFRNKPPRDLGEMNTWLLGTCLSLVRDLAHQHSALVVAVEEQADVIDTLLDGETAGVSPEDAAKCLRVLEYARSRIEIQLAEDDTLNADQKAMLRSLLDDANSSVEVISEFVEDEEGEEAEAESPQGNA